MPLRLPESAFHSGPDLPTAPSLPCSAHPSPFLLTIDLPPVQCYLAGFQPSIGVQEAAPASLAVWQ